MILFVFIYLYLFIYFLPYLGVTAQSTAYQPECRAWDRTVIQMQQSLNAIGGAATCNKSADCTGLSCTLNLWVSTRVTYLGMWGGGQDSEGCLVWDGTNIQMQLSPNAIGGTARYNKSANCTKLHG